MKKVIGIGGLFFKAKDVAKLKDWYKENLGFVTSDWGASMVWTDPKTQATVRTEWSPFKESSDYFAPSTLPYMINYLVDDLRALIDVLRKDGVTIIGDISEYDYGKFAHIMDPEGRKIELYQPIAGGDTPPAWTDKVVGLGGIFFKSDDPGKIKEWYKKHLDIDDYISPLHNDDKMFAGTTKPYVFSYLVRDIKSLRDQIRTSTDPEGNKIILLQS